MIGSYRKYVDPSKAVEILKEGFRSHMGVSDSQQVSFYNMSVDGCREVLGFTDG